MDEAKIQEFLEGLRTDTLGAIELSRNQWQGHYEELKALGAPLPEIKTKLENAIRRLDEAEALIRRPGLNGNGHVAEYKTIGLQIIQNPELTALRGKWFKGMRVLVPFNGLFPQDIFTERKMVMSGTLIEHVRQPGIVPPGVTQTRVRDLIPRVPVSSNSIDWVVETAFTNAASPQLEGSAKSESDLTFTVVTIPIRTLAHWLAASRQVLDDLPVLQNYIEERLLDGLMDLEDRQIVSGDGTGQNLKGLIPSGTAVTITVAGDSRIDKVARMMEQLMNAKLVPSGTILNASDWMRMQTIKEDSAGANTGLYILGGPRGIAAPMLWGVPVAATTGVPSGIAVVGAFSTHVRLLDRMEAQIDISNEHADFWVRNLVAIRAEERVGLAVTRSDAVVYNSSF